MLGGVPGEILDTRNDQAVNLCETINWVPVRGMRALETSQSNVYSNQSFTWE